MSHFIALLQHGCLLLTIYQDNFASLYFHEFRGFCSVTKLNLQNIAMPHENIFLEIIEIAIFVKISWYTYPTLSLPCYKGSIAWAVTDFSSQKGHMALLLVRK